MATAEGVSARARSADFQFAVSQAWSLRRFGRSDTLNLLTLCRLQIGDTAQRGKAATKVARGLPAAARPNGKGAQEISGHARRAGAAAARMAVRRRHRKIVAACNDSRRYGRVQLCIATLISAEFRVEGPIHFRFEASV